jgi:serine/threonine protein kinase/tetratricopeptide (TPR) repeat protein
MVRCGVVYESTVVGDRFAIERVAGKGGMGTVYRATDRATGALAAVKILPNEGGSRVARFAREARLLAELAHPNIVRYLAEGTTALGEPFLAMEWLDGEVLHQRLKREGLDPNEAVQLAIAVANALGAAHARGVVHRDIKPSNLLLVDGDVSRVKVLDFGIAHVAADSMTRTGIAMGTPGYMSPEQARGARNIDARADVFSIGCVLFECLVGRPPFVGDSAMSVLAKILLEEAPRLGTLRDDLPIALEATLAGMLSKQPSARPSDGIAAARELERVGTIGSPRRAPSRPREPALTTGEQRLVCIVFAAGALSGEPASRDSSPLIGVTPPSRGSSPLIATPPPSRDSSPQIAGTPSDGDVNTVVLDTSNTMTTLSSAVTAHGGRVEVLVGGSIVVVLLGHGAATDQAARAARCALAVRAVVPDAPMALAIGRTASGDQIPLSKLIDHAAAMIETPVSCDARGTLPIRVDDVSAGLLDLRFTIDGEQGRFALRGEREVGEHERTLLGRKTPCVGRERELAHLLAIFEECAAESVARVVVVTAPPGVGKSRLRHELLARISAARADAEIWIGRGDPLSAGAPFAMLAQALRRAAGIAEGEPADARLAKLGARVARSAAAGDAHRVIEFLGEIVGAQSASDASVALRAARVDPQLMGDQMLRACEDFVAAECAAHPVVIVLEDLHWGDLPTVRFVDAIVRQLPDRPLLVLALARPEVDVAFPRLWSERNPIRLALPELSKKAAEKLVRVALGGGVAAATVERVVERAAGNAFYLEELVRAVAEGKGDRLPETIVAMAQARIESLEPDARMVLRAASIFGQVFWRGGVMALLDGRTQVRDWLDELVARELVSARRDSRYPGDTEYVFRHALVREAAYAMLTERDRTRGHRRAGEWLEARIRGERPNARAPGVEAIDRSPARRGQATEAEAVALAEHFERGGDPRRSVEWYRQAAERALEGDDLGAAIDRAERAIGCLSSLGGIEESHVGTLRLLQSGAHLWRGEYAAAADRGEEAIARLAVASEPWLTAIANVAYACERRLDRARVIALCEVLAGTTVAPETYRAYVHAVAMTASTVLWHGDVTLQNRLLARLDGIAAAIGDGDPVAVAWILLTRAWRSMRDNDLSTSLALDMRVSACFMAVGDLRRGCQQRGNVGYDELMLGAFDRAEQSLRDAIAMSERIGVHQVHATARHNLGLVLLRQGRIAEARVEEQAALDAFVVQGNRRFEAAARNYLAMIEIAAGDFAAAIAHARAAIDVSALRSTFHATLSSACRLSGQADDALAYARTAMQLMEQHGQPEEGEAQVRLAYAEALHATGATAAARRVIADAEARVIDAASRILDAEWRASFLEAIPEHAGTLALARMWRE